MKPDVWGMQEFKMSMLQNLESIGKFSLSLLA